MHNKNFYRRNLPHLQPKGGCFFVTFRLKDSIPKAQLWQLKEKYDLLLNQTTEKTERYNLHKQFFGEYDRLLDLAINSPTFLSDRAVADIVKKELHRFDGQLYDLLAYTIMSNHVHILIDTSIQLSIGEGTANYQYLHQIMKRLKGSSAVTANRYLHRDEAFWQPESYDHLVRNERELLNIISYIVENPVKAGLVKHWQEWKYTYWKSS